MNDATGLDRTTRRRVVKGGVELASVLLLGVEPAIAESKAPTQNEPSECGEVHTDDDSTTCSSNVGTVVSVHFEKQDEDVTIAPQPLRSGGHVQ